MKSTLPIIIREFEENDRHFIVDSWSRQLYEAMPYSYCPAHLYFPNQIKLINDILNSSECLVACLAEDPDILIGYIVFEHIQNVLILHWICVKKDFRKMYVMSDLLTSAHKTWKLDMIMITQPGKLFSKYRKKLKLFYDPFHLYRKFV
jgi:hypothetical protein